LTRNCENIDLSHLNDLRRFYEILAILEKKLGGKRLLGICNGRMNWPQRGVYFFFEPGENRSNSGEGLRVVRVGTHALTNTSRTTLWHRLSQHQGTLKSGGGNHRGSVFRLHVGTALLNRGSWLESIHETWGKGSTASTAVRQVELPLEQAVSQYIHRMPFLWLAVEDSPGPDSLRGMIERNSIALLSNSRNIENPLDPSSTNWLGHFADREPIRRSGVWNVNHGMECYQQGFLDLFNHLVNSTL
jgi:hypothetical protein